MLFSNWLQPLRIRIDPRKSCSRRDRWMKTWAAADSRAEQSVERLESRLYLSGLSSYSTASSDWFGVLDSTFSSSGGLSGNSSGESTASATDVRQYLVRLTPEATAQAGSLRGVQRLISDGAVELVVTGGLGLPGQVTVATTERDSVQVMQSLSSNESVAHFEEDFSVGATTARFPNEEGNSAEFSRQFGLHNTGQTGGVVDADIDAPEAWDISIGSPQIVTSVIDSGVDFTHPDLYLNIWLNQGELPPQFVDPDATTTLSDVDSDGLITFRDLNDAANSTFVTDINANGYIDAGDLLEDPKWADGIDTDDNGFEDDLVGWDFFENDNKPFDEHGHGTHVAGILGAVGDNGFGVTGVNWQTSIMPLRFLDEENQGDISDAVEAINYTTMMRTRDSNPVNVRVSNNSWGTSGSFSQSLSDAVDGNARADILFVAAAGNGDILGQGIDNDNAPFFPASLDLPNVLSVTALDDRGELAAFANFGAGSVDIAAPGVDITSLEPGEGFVSRSGTSMATPFVAGVGALVFDVFPAATAAEVREAILSGAATTTALNGFVADGRSLNAFGALTASTFAPVPELVPVATITADGTVSLDITVTYTDDGSVDTNSFDIRDVEITRQGFSETLLTPASVATTTIDVDGRNRDAAVYTFTAPGGTFDATDNGTWFVSLREGEIQDDLGLYSAPRELGQFTVSIDDPSVFFVNTTVDTIDADLGDGVAEDSAGQTSLRAAIMHANQAASATTIVVPDGVYALTIPGRNENASATGDIDLTSAQGITIIGGGALSTTIDAQQLDRVFDIAPEATVTITGLTIRNGNADQGGGIENSGTLTLNDSLVTTNTAETAGGGVFSDGDLTVSDSSIEENVVTSRLFASGGGGIAIAGNAGTSAGRTSISGSSIVNNISAAGGGGIIADDAELSLTNVTIVANTAQRSDGGGVQLRETGNSKPSTLSSVTITGNTAMNGSGGGVSSDLATADITVSNSIIAQNMARTSADVEALIVSDGTNLFGQPSETQSNWRTLAANAADFDQIGTAQSPLDPQLQPLERSTGLVQARGPVAGGRSSNDDLAGNAELVLTPGLPIVYSTVELEPNNSRGEAMRLDDRGWSLDENADIANSTTIPHVTITGTGDGTFDYYSIVVPDSDSTVIFDIDLEDVPLDKRFDPALVLFKSDGTVLATNDTASIDSGSIETTEPRVEHLFTEPGTYVVAVATSDSLSGFIDELTTSAPPPSTEYTLHVSIPGHDQFASKITTDFPNVLAAGTQIAALPNGPVVRLASPEPLVASAAVSIRALADGSETIVGSFAVVDLDRDGNSDVVTTTAFDLRVAMGRADGTFAPPVIYDIDDLAIPRTDNTQLITGDINGDQLTDVFIVREYSSSIITLLTVGDGSFQQGITTVLPDGLRPREPRLEDVNSDGVPDLLFTEVSNDIVGVALGASDGTFEVLATYDAGINPRHFDVADVNQDGLLDVAAASANSRQVSLLLGQGDGTFQPGSPHPVSPGAQFAAPLTSLLADVTGDNLPDIVSGVLLSNGIAISPGTGDGTFSEPVLLPLLFDEAPVPKEVRDYNSDNHLDLLVAVGSELQMLLGDGQGGFTRHQIFEAGFGSGLSFPAGGTVTYNLNQDGVLDIPYHSFGSDVVAIAHGRGDGTFRSPQAAMQTNDRLLAIEAGDINADGVTDIVAVYEGIDAVELFIGVGNGDYTSPTSIDVGAGPVDIALADMNEDGNLDIVVAEGTAQTVRIVPGNGDGSFGTHVVGSLSSAPQALVVAHSFEESHGLDINVLSGTDILTIPGRLRHSGQPAILRQRPVTWSERARFSDLRIGILGCQNHKEVLHCVTILRA